MELPVLLRIRYTIQLLPGYQEGGEAIILPQLL
jgi:hypothetical protein